MLLLGYYFSPMGRAQKCNGWLYLCVFMTKAVERSMAKASKVREFDIQKMSQYSIDGRAVLLSHLHLEKLRQNISHNLNSFAYHKQQLIHIEETKKKENKTVDTNDIVSAVDGRFARQHCRIRCIFMKLLGLRQVSNVR